LLDSHGLHVLGVEAHDRIDVDVQPSPRFSRGLAWAPDGEVIFVAQGVSTVGMYDWRSGRKLRDLDALKWGGPGPSPPTAGPSPCCPIGGSSWTAIAVSPDQRWLAVGGGAWLDLDILDIGTGSCIRRLQGKGRGVVEALLLDARGDLLVSASTDATVRIYDPHRGTEIRVLRGHIAGRGGGVPDMAWFGANDGLIASIGRKDWSLRVWRTRTGEALVTTALTACPTQLASHGDTLWVGFRDGTIQIYSHRAHARHEGENAR